MPVTNTNTNMTNRTELKPSLSGVIQQLMDREMEANLVHAQFGKTINVPRNAGTTTATLRRWVELDPSTTVLQEGVVPDPKLLSQESVSVPLNAYGEYVKITDKLDYTALDKPMVDSVQLLSRMGARSLDLVVRGVLSAATNVLYANGKTGRAELTKDTDALTSKDVQKAVRLLERTNTRKINGDFIGILGPDTKYMLMNDPMWIDVAKYQDAAKLYNNEVGKLYGVRFVETSEASILEGAGASSADVAQTFIFGDQAYATTQLSGGGQPRIIVKPLGSAGAEDPLDQFGTVGYKVEGYGAAIMNQTHLVCIESALLD